MTEDEQPQGGQMRWVPDGAFVVMPLADVVALFGHKMASSTRSLMGKHGYPTLIKGYDVEEVKHVSEKLDPTMLERWRERKRREAAEEAEWVARLEARKHKPKTEENKNG
jgi:hypothetical protein